MRKPSGSVTDESGERSASLHGVLKSLEPNVMNSVCKVMIVEKRWYDHLVDWLTFSDAPHPGSMDMKLLMKGTKLRTDLKYGLDFEVIPSNAFIRLKEQFKGLRGYERNMILHPRTGDPMVLLVSVTIEVRYEQRKIMKEASPDWQVYDVCKQLCDTLKLSAQEYGLRSENTGSEIKDDLPIGEIRKDIPGPLRLAKRSTAKLPPPPPPQIIIPIKMGVPSTRVEASPSRGGPTTARRGSLITNPEIISQRRGSLLGQPWPKPVIEDEPSDDISPIDVVDTIMRRPPPPPPPRRLPVMAAMQHPDETRRQSAPRAVRAASKKDAAADMDLPSLDVGQGPPLSILDHFALRATAPFPKPVGLVNLGNTCFFNAAVQCLVRIQALTAFMLAPTFEDNLNVKNPNGSRGSIARAYRNFVMDVCSGGNQARNPGKLRAAITSKYRGFANYGQHDSQELLGALLDGLHEDMNQADVVGGCRRSPVRRTEHKMDSWQMHKAKNFSPVQDMFHGRLFSSLECPACGKSESVHDPFMFLSLSIPRGTYGHVKLSDCVSSFSQVDRLDANNKWKCPHCNRMVCATKRMGVDRCAPVLIIHLKRFSGHSYMSTKIETPVDYPDILNTSMFSVAKNGQYKLTAAVFHSGGLGSGHYVAAAYDEPTRQWYNFNDTITTKIPASGAHSSQAYILFYQLM